MEATSAPPTCTPQAASTPHFTQMRVPPGPHGQSPGLHGEAQTCEPGFVCPPSRTTARSPPHPSQTTIRSIGDSRARAGGWLAGRVGTRLLHSWCQNRKLVTPQASAVPGGAQKAGRGGQSSWESGLQAEHLSVQLPGPSHHIVTAQRPMPGAAALCPEPCSPQSIGVGLARRREELSPRSSPTCPQ